MIIVRLLSPEPVGWLSTTKLYSGVGADIVMESITLIDPILVHIAGSDHNLILQPAPGRSSVGVIA
jgi:hypothetical protein